MTSQDPAQLKPLVDSLERTDRLVLILHYAEHLSTAEIACVLDRTENEVMDRLSQLQSLAKQSLDQAGALATAPS